jgi:hypothetical protein
MSSAETKNMRNWKSVENQFKALLKKYLELLSPSIPNAQTERMIMYVVFFTDA